MSIFEISSPIISTLLISIILFSCNLKDPISKLDRDRGYKGLVLGDSLYSHYMKEIKNSAYDSEIIKRKVFNNVFTQSKKVENLDH